MNYRTDFYPVDLADANTPIDFDTYFGIGHTFLNNKKSTLDSINLYFDKTGLPLGNITVKIYAMAGTHGTDGLPTGAALATSSNFDVNTIAGGGAAIANIPFTGANRITLEANTHYVFVLSAINTWTTIKCIEVTTDSTTVAHQGNTVWQDSDGGAWLADAALDVIFSVMVDSVETRTVKPFGGGSLMSTQVKPPIKRWPTRDLSSKESNRWNRSQVASKLSPAPKPRKLNIPKPKFII